VPLEVFVLNFVKQNNAAAEKPVVQAKKLKKLFADGR